jgi:hypothetical protein
MKLALLLLIFSMAKAHAFDAGRFAPLLRLHPKEKFRPADPAEVFRAAAPAPGQAEFAIPETPPASPAPWIWQRSGSSITDLLPPAESWDLIDYWYFVPYNEAGLWFGLGDHEGDWEGVSLLFREGALTAAYYSQHDSGSWYCARDLERSADGRILVYSSLGSHSSFPRPGEYRRGLFFLGNDLVDAGEFIPMAVRALADEPYLNFGGRWGRENLRPGSRGPISPHPEKKFLPRKIKVEEAAWLTENCLPS